MFCTHFCLVRGEYKIKTVFRYRRWQGPRVCNCHLLWAVCLNTCNCSLEIKPCEICSLTRAIAPICCQYFRTGKGKQRQWENSHATFFFWEIQRKYINARLGINLHATPDLKTSFSLTNLIEIFQMGASETIGNMISGSSYSYNAQDKMSMGIS